MRVLTWTSLVTLSALSIGAALAENASPQSEGQSSPPTTPYQTLLSQGFEVKNVLLIPADVGTRLTGNIQQETVMVTLQKGSVTATCWVLFAAWNQQNLGGSTNTPCNILH